MHTTVSDNQEDSVTPNAASTVDDAASSGAGHVAAALAVGAVALAATGAAQGAVSIGSTTRVINKYDGWRFLTQATFGPRATDLDSSATSTTATAKKLWSSGYSAWLDEQFARSPQRTTYQSLLDKNYSWPNQWGRADSNGWYCLGRNKNMWKDASMLTDALWEQFLAGEDQLRQRVAFALSEIFVVSMQNTLLEWIPKVAAFHDLLVKHAFGNFRALIEDVCRSPAMGFYLTHFRNEKPAFDQANKEIRIPDQNFARELMQLFTIGVVELNMDGTPKLDGDGNTIPTYKPADIKALSYVFTGWAYWSKGVDGEQGGLTFNQRLDRGFHTGDKLRTIVDTGIAKDPLAARERTDPNDPNSPMEVDTFLDVYEAAGGSQMPYTGRHANAERLIWSYMAKPMMAYDRKNPIYLALEAIKTSDPTKYNNNIDMFRPRHAEVSDYQKGFGLTGTAVPTFLKKSLAVDGTCEGDMKKALDILLAHPNVAPFIAKQLIQRLVTSNPSPAYVKRVALQFKSSNYSLKTLVKAVLLDTEARDVVTIATSDTYGKLREPILRTTAVLRGIKHATPKHLGRPLYAMATTHAVTDGVDENNFLTSMGQGAFCSTSVFNFFRPGHVPSGSNMAQRELVAPEFQIASGVETTAWINAMLNMFYHLGFGRVQYPGQQSYTNRDVDYSATGISTSIWGLMVKTGISLDFRSELTLLKTTAGRTTFMKRIDDQFFGGRMSSGLKSKLQAVLDMTDADMEAVLQAMPWRRGQCPTSESDWNLNKVITCYFLAIISAEFVVQK